MNSRHKGRELALQFIYCWDMNPATRDSLSAFILDHNKNKEDTAYFFAVLLVNGVLEHAEELDTKISKHLKHWTLERLSKVDLALLRLSAYELLYQKDTPAAVVINEAVVLSKEFCGDDSYRFINGVLESLIAKKVVVNVKKKVKRKAVRKKA